MRRVDMMVYTVRGGLTAWIGTQVKHLGGAGRYFGNHLFSNQTSRKELDSVCLLGRRSFCTIEA